MCLAYPGRIITIEKGTSPRCGTVDFGGIQSRVCLDWLPEAEVGEYVIVHVGFAISRLDEQDARMTLDLLRGASGEEP